MRVFQSIIILGVTGLAVFFWLTRPASAPVATIAQVQGNAAEGADVFHMAGCGGCHRAVGGDPVVLSGGQRFASPFGTFVAPNVSMDPDRGIGSWDITDFDRAVRVGVSPQGHHYYPAFPYASYAHMTDRDLANLWTFWQTLPSSNEASQVHDLPLLFAWRRPVGVWKTLYSPVTAPDVLDADDVVTRGQYLAVALGHCAECHTPRTALGGLDASRWMQGAATPDGKGKIPDITAGGLGWTAQDIAEYLKSGFTPDYDMAGGKMAEVIENTSKLGDADRLAIGTYLAQISR